jgi:acyl-coenzyme A synthetase/AMP-(fatty) acid ligase
MAELPLRPLKDCGIALALERAAEKDSDTPVLLDKPLDVAPELGCALNYGSLAAVMLDTSAALAAAGVTRGDRVAVVKRNNFDILVLSYALMRLGATAALLSDQLDPAAREQLFARLKPDFVVTDRPPATAGAAGHPPRYLLVGESEQADTAHIRDFWGAPHRKPRPALGNEVAMALHSSGTTGVPKLIVHSARNLERIAYVGRYQALAHFALLRSDDLVAASLAWVHGRAAVGYALAFARNVGLLAISDPRPDSAFDLLTRHAPSIVETHPNIYLQWQRAMGHKSEEVFSNVRMFLSTADAMPPATKSALLNASRRRMPLFVEVYGMTEMGPATAKLTRQRRRRRHSRLVGRAIPGFSRVRVVDPATGDRLSHGRVGSIQISTRAPLIRYLGQETHFTNDGRRRWFSTGDIGSQTRTGAIRLLDRQVDRLEGVGSCVELEERLLARLPDALEIVVLKGPTGAAVPVIATRNNAPVDPVAWQSATSDMPALAEPVHLPFDELPMTATWKVRRFALRDRLAPSLSEAR